MKLLKFFREIYMRLYRFLLGKNDFSEFKRYSTHLMIVLMFFYCFFRFVLTPLINLLDRNIEIPYTFNLNEFLYVLQLFIHMFLTLKLLAYIDYKLPFYMKLYQFMKSKTELSKFKRYTSHFITILWLFFYFSTLIGTLLHIIGVNFDILVIRVNYISSLTGFTNFLMWFFISLAVLKLLIFIDSKMPF